ncbi:hypothetical protein [Neisseria animaloris]|nr:hypothetical protein [Neisseria animaloris]
MFFSWATIVRAGLFSGNETAFSDGREESGINRSYRTGAANF